MTYTFPAHGSFSIDYQPPVFVLNLHGSWNDEAAHALSSHGKELFAQIKPTHFMTVVRVVDWYASPQAMRTLNELTEWAITHGLEKEAVVVVDNDLSKAIVDEFGTPSHGNYQRKFFDDETSARAWLNS